MNQQSLQIKQVEWESAADILRKIRTEVFIKEQAVPEELEWDDNDQNCVHLLAFIDDQPVATARFLSTGQIGRMAVLKPYRSLGVGKALMNKLIAMAEEMKFEEIFLNAQIGATGFYRKFGFIEHSELFNEANIAHIRMIKTIEE